MSIKKRILVCPLDWGLGHATRCIPVIRELEKQGAEVIIAADKLPLKLLKIEFPNNSFISFPGYDITYPDNGNMVFHMLKNLSKITSGIWKEHKLLKEILVKNQIDAVISDNRFGLWNENVPCVFITHQLMIKCPQNLQFLESFIFRFNQFFIKKFDNCWVPDSSDGDNLSGDLSHKYPHLKNTYFVGPLSRFNSRKQNQKETAYDLLIILSGPEPQRTIFENLILHQLAETTIRILMVRGIPEAPEDLATSKNIVIKSHLNSEEMEKAISSSELILCRPGYSSIMDLVTLGKKAAFVPTPGQTEQNYLARYYELKKCYYQQSQETFNLKKLLEESAKYSGCVVTQNNEMLKKKIQELLLSLD